jgi:hypothetical protein
MFDGWATGRILLIGLERISVRRQVEVEVRELAPKVAVLGMGDQPQVRRQVMSHQGERVSSSDPLNFH